jgi:hypothetical protein
MATRTKTAETPAASITPEALEAMLANMAELKATVAKYQAEAVAVTKAMAEDKPAKAQATNGKSDLSAKNELATIRAFKRAGHGVVIPHIDTLTFGKWVEKGFRPKAGSKAVKVNNLRLFCKAQVRPISKDELKAMKDQRTAATKRGAKVVPFNGGEAASPQLL